MKNQILLLTILLGVLLLPSVHAVSDAEALKISVDVADKNIQPGETLNFRITFTNTGSKSITDIKYEVVAGSDISGYPTGKTGVGGLNAGELSVRELPLSISGSAKKEIHTLSLKAEYSINQVLYKTQYNYNFQVGSDINLHLEEVSFDSKQIEPGKTFKMSTRFKNVGSSTAKQLTATFYSNNTTGIKPVLAGGTSFLREIPAGSTGVFSFEIAVESGLESKTYPISIILNYEDESKSKMSSSFTAGLPVSGTPKLVILNTKIENGKFEVDIENLGSAKAKAIKMELLQNGKVMAVDIDNELKVDKHSTLRFDNYAAGIAELRLTYLDDTSKEYSTSSKVTIPSSAKNRISSTSIAVFILFLFAIGEGYYIYTLRKKAGLKK